MKFQRGIQQGLLGRISRTAVMEYHGFGIISEGIDSGCHYMIVGAQGDWTRSVVNSPPKYLWTREMKVREAYSFIKLVPDAIFLLLCEQSLPACLIFVISIVVGSASARAPVSEQCSLPVCSSITGS